MNDTARKLATIVALDVAGYSARTEADEAKTTSEIAALRTVIEEIAGRRGGRVFNTAGDGFMLEFGSSMAAVEAAFELAETCEPKVRVGVHVGDVVPQANGDLLGHGVNVAARLMAQAVPGSVLISADVKHMMRGPLVQSLRAKGTIKLAKMVETIEVFAFLPEEPVRGDLRVRLDQFLAKRPSRFAAWATAAGGAVAIVAGVAWWVATGPQTETDREVSVASIAVLPFENLSSEKDASFFATGIQDEILTRLAKIGSLKVISRTSTAHLASKPDNLPELARQLGVANIVEGSVQREGDSVRVNVQLIRASTDDHLWAEIYDRKLHNIFSVQSEIATAIATALNATVTGEEKRSIALKSTTNTAAYDAYLRGLSLIHQNAGTAKAAAFFKEAVQLDKDFALAWAYLARLEAQTYSRREATAAQRNIARSALDNALKSPDLPEVQLAQGFYTYYVEEDHARARQQFEQVQAKWPNEIESFFALGSIARRQGRWVESKAYFEQAVALDPMRADLRFSLAGVLVAVRELDAALAIVDGALQRWPEDVKFIAEKARILQRLGRFEEADGLLKPLRTRPEGFVYRRIVSQALLQRKYGEAIETLEALLAQNPDNLTAGNLRVELGRLRQLAGDARGAVADIEQARVLLTSEFVRQPKNETVLNSLAWVYCFRGEREKAVKYAEKAIGLSPPTQDASSGPRYEDTRMRIWAYFGDRGRAIPALERLQKIPNGYYTPAMLGDPIFDKLRGETKFDAMAANADH
jgi:TolB-like protein/class 3 adenylate cyclase